MQSHQTRAKKRLIQKAYNRLIQKKVQDIKPGNIEWSEPELYRTLVERGFLEPPAKDMVDITLIPYFSWANRGLSFMDVWLNLGL